MGKLYVKQSGIWKQVQALWVKASGVWKSPNAALITQGGIGKQFYPDVAGITTYSSPGTYSYVVPAGVSSVIATVVGAGGGSGATNSSGNIIGSGCGGSGGYQQNQTIAVTPGETLTVVVGLGGYGGNYRFNSNYQYFNTIYGRTDNPGTYNGGPGGTTSISRGATSLLAATGGGGGLSMSSGGAAGSPNGVAGGAWNGNTGVCNTLNYGGVNALGLGSGGNNPQCSVGQPGQDGYVQIKPVNVTRVSYSVPGTYSFVPPAGILSVTVSYPTLSGLATTTYATTPGVPVTVTIGDYGYGSSFGTLSAAAFTKNVFNFSGNVDHLDYFSITAGSATGASYSGTGSAYTHQTGCAAVGITLSEYSELYHGDLTSSVSVYTVPNSALVNTTQIYGTYSSGRYQYALPQQQPTASNGYVYIVSPYDPGSSEGYYAYSIYLQQVVSFAVSY